MIVAMLFFCSISSQPLRRLFCCVSLNTATYKDSKLSIEAYNLLTTCLLYYILRCTLTSCDMRPLRIVRPPGRGVRGVLLHPPLYTV